MINNVAAQSGSDLSAVDLSVGTIYLGDPRGTVSEEPIYELVGTANVGDLPSTEGRLRRRHVGIR
ncbi:hypothetical protein ACFXHK_43890, partial [Embleya sp. NPDC059267]|uniref:hypothetical protein n=1 Tax=Embleya sp. NPDC059267 TaxID=3346798 RepID=UPI0036D181CD